MQNKDVEFCYKLGQSKKDCKTLKGKLQSEKVIGLIQDNI